MPTKADEQREPHMRLEMKSQARLLAAARAMILQFSQRLGFPENIAGQISLAVDEALCNVINHGYERREDGHIALNLWSLDDADSPGLRIVVEDRAKQVDPATIKPRNLDDIRPGGLGVHIIRQVMDHVQYEHREGGGMRLTMSKRLKDDPARARSSDCDKGQCESWSPKKPGDGGASSPVSGKKAIKERA